MTEPPSWDYDTATDLDKGALERLGSFPREPDLLVYGLRSAAALLCRAWLRLYHRFRVVGCEHLPDESFVIVANHQSHLDSAAILAAIPLRRLHRAYPAAAKDYFFKSVPRLAAATIVVNAMPFARDSKGSETLRMCIHLVEQPNTVLILYPEGTRSPTGELGEFLPGIGAILAGRDIPVVPCRLRGVYESWPKDARFPKPRRVSATFGPPRRFADRKRGKDSARTIAAELRDAVAAL